MAAYHYSYIAAPLLQQSLLCVPVFHFLRSPSLSPSSKQMQGLRPRHHSQTLSRRKLHFDESKLGLPSAVLPTRKRQRTTVPNETDVECGSTAGKISSQEREQKQETGLFKLAATYRRRRSKLVQGNNAENFDKPGTAGQNGDSRRFKGSCSKAVDVSSMNEHGLPTSGSVHTSVSRAVNGSSKGRPKHANADERGLAQANLGALNVGVEALSLPDLSIAIESSNSNHRDVGSHMQGSCAMDVVPLAQYSSILDVVPSDNKPLSHAIDTAILYQGPFPSFPRPSQEECGEVCHRLSQLHGPLEEYAKHKIEKVSEKQVLALEYHKEGDSKTIKDVVDGPSSAELREALPSGHSRERHTVLDSLVGTMLSQNTTDTNSRRAFASLKAKFPTWEAVYAADPKAVEDAIRCGGLAEIKTSRILTILKALEQERGKLCLEYVRNLSVDEIKLELSRFKGVGPKTIACVLMFHLQQNEFPVDTHVFRITKMLGWVPAKADREKAYLHLNHRIPNHLKFDLHCLLVTHGKRCPRCAKGGRTQKPADGPCPLVNLNSKCIEASPCDLSFEP